MSTFNPENYVTRTPLYEAGPGVKNRQSPTMTFISEKQIPGCNYYLEYGWIYGIPEPNPHIHEHVHDYDEIVLHWGGDWKRPQVLGAEIEFYIGGQQITFNTTSGIFIPAGVPHGPLTWKKFDFPHVELALMLGTGDVKKGWAKSGIKESKGKLPVKKDDIDYEQYVIRSPLRESPGAISGQGRQSPTMTVMSGVQIPGVKYYIEMGWIWDVTETIDEMKHDNFDEIVLHIGGDPQDPEDLGADMSFALGGQRMEFSKNFGMFIPKGMTHGPLEWQNVRRPHIEMAMMLGAGTIKEGWGMDLSDITRRREALKAQQK